MKMFGSIVVSVAQYWKYNWCHCVYMVKWQILLCISYHKNEIFIKKQRKIKYTHTMIDRKYHWMACVFCKTWGRLILRDQRVLDAEQTGAELEANGAEPMLCSRPVLMIRITWGLVNHTEHWFSKYCPRSPGGHVRPSLFQLHISETSWIFLYISAKRTYSSKLNAGADVSICSILPL